MSVQLPDAMIRDTVAAVFSDPAYHRTSLMQRIGTWLLDLLQSIFSGFGSRGLPTPVFWTIFVVILLALLSWIARLLYLAYHARQSGPPRGQAGDSIFGRGQEADAWAAARLHAARGNYTAAAHALYLGLLHAIARRGEIELHESKTIGDYLRDLAARSSSRFSRFGEFARSYETVIYGVGFCDRERYERLLGLARTMVEPGG